MAQVRNESAPPTGANPTSYRLDNANNGERLADDETLATVQQ